MNAKRVLFFYILMLISSRGLLAALDGTSTVVVEDTYFTFTSANNSTDGFVWLRNGFTIDNTTLTLDQCGPVSGDIGLNSQTIILNHDLMLDSTVTMTGDGTIKGEGHKIVLGGDLTYTDQLTLDSATTTNITIDGQGNSLVLGSGSSIHLADGETVTFKNITIENLSGSRIIMDGTTSKIIFDDANIYLDSDYTVTQGAIDFEHNCSINGYANTNRKFIFQSSQNLTITADAVLEVGMNMTLEHDNASVTNNFIFSDKSSRLLLNGGTLSIAQSNGLSLEDGTLAVGHTPSIAGNLTIGDGLSAANDVNLELSPGVLIDLASGTFTYDNQAG